MKTKKTLATLITLAVLQTLNLSGQETDDLFLTSFRGTIRPGNGDNASSTFSRTKLIRQCAGEGLTKEEVNEEFALVYNATADSIQVVNRSDGSHVCTAFHFQGGTVTQVDNRLVRFTFVFNDTQAEAIGSAVITERPPNNNNNRARISGRMQFTVPGEGGSGSSEEVTSGFVQKSATASTTGDRIVTATFNVGREFRGTDVSEETVAEAEQAVEDASQQVTEEINNITNNNNNNNNNENTRQSIIDATANPPNR